MRLHYYANAHTTHRPPRTLQSGHTVLLAQAVWCRATAGMLAMLRVTPHSSGSLQNR